MDTYHYIYFNLWGYIISKMVKREDIPMAGEKIEEGTILIKRRVLYRMRNNVKNWHQNILQNRKTKRLISYK